MSISQRINALLSFVGIVIVKRDTLDRVMFELNRVQNEAKLNDVTDESECATKVMQEQVEIGFSNKELLKHQICTKWEVVDCLARLLPTQRESRICPLCGFNGSDTSYKKYQSQCIFGGGVLVRHQCPSCDVIFGADKMFELSRDELSQDYDWHYKVYDEGDSTEQELRTFYALQPSREGVYVNYGAGAWSRSVEVLRSEGWQVFAYEPHGSASTGAEHVITSRAELESIRFDGVFSNNVLEHLRNPADELQRMSRLLKPGGRMSHSTPCFEYLYEYTRFHLFFFLGRSKELVAEQAGLSIVSFEVDKEYMNCVLIPVDR